MAPCAWLGPPCFACYESSALGPCASESRDSFPTHHPCVGMRATGSYPDAGRTVDTMSEDLERLKQSIPLLQYLQQHNWSGRPAEARSEFVGLCRCMRKPTPPSSSTP